MSSLVTGVCLDPRVVAFLYHVTVHTTQASLPPQGVFW